MVTCHVPVVLTLRLATALRPSLLLSLRSHGAVGESRSLPIVPGKNRLTRPCLAPARALDSGGDRCSV